MPIASRHDLIFGHEGDARVAASVTMIGMVAVLIGGSFMAIGPRLNQDSAVARNAAGGAPQGTVRVVGATPLENENNDVACAQQVWPNIDQRCLVRADSKTPAPAEAKAAANVVAPPATQENDKLSPLTAAVVDHPSPPQDDATSGSGVPEDTALLRQTAPINVTASPNMTADVGNDDVDEAPPPRSVEPRKRRHIGFPLHLHSGGFRF
jgi:hypothetical protein